MEKLLNCFLEESKSRGVIFNNFELEEIQKLSKEKKYDFYKKFYELYSKFYKNLIIPLKSSSFYIHYHSESSFNVSFYDEMGNELETLLFKNIERDKLEIFLYKQLIGGK